MFGSGLRLKTTGLLTALVMLAACGGSGATSTTNGAETPEPPTQESPTTSEIPTETTDSTTASSEAHSEPKETVSVTLTVPLAGSLINTVLFVAENGGHFAEHGLDVEIVATEGGGPDFQALLSGDADFNFSTATAPISAIVAGQDVVIVMAGNTQPAVDFVVSPDVMAASGVTADSSVAERMAVLEGLQIGVSRPGTFFDHLLQFSIGAYDVSNVEVVATGGGATALASLSEGQVDGLVYSPPVVHQAVHSGAAEWLVRPSEGEIPELAGLIQSSLNVRPDYIESNRAVVESMVAALHEAAVWINENGVDEIVELISPDFGEMDQEVLASSVETMKNVVSSTGCTTQEGIDAVIRLLEVGGGVESGTTVTVDEIATNEFIPSGC